MMGPIPVTRLSLRSRSGARAGLTLLAAVALSAGSMPHALARQGAAPGGRIPCALASKDTLSSEEQKQIKDAVEAGLTRLRDADPAVSVRGRDELVEPLACDGVTVAFRAAYGQALEPSLRELIRGGDARLAVNALLIMGRVKSSTSTPVLRLGLEDRRAQVRLAAASGYKELLSPPMAGLPDRAIEPVLTSLGEALAKELDPNVADVLIAALDAARSNDALRARANLQIVDGLSTRLRAIRAEDSAGAWAPAILRGVEATKNTLLQQIGANMADREFARKSAMLGSLALVYVADRLARRQVTDQSPLDLTLEAIAASAEGEIVFAHIPAGGTETVQAIDLRNAYNRAVESGNAADLQRRLQSWIGSNGLFTRAPYNMLASDLAVKP